jgi:hypothetical protein
VIHTTTSARIARILAEHPRCVAHGTSIGHVPRLAATTSERVALFVLRSWLAARGPRIAEVTLDESLAGVTLAFASIGEVNVIVFTVTGTRTSDTTFYVAIELDPEAP